MPAMDLNLRLANSVAIDVSTAGPDVTAGVNLGRVGLPDQAYFVVVIEDGMTDAIEPLTFTMQFTDDNGSTWHSVATVTVNVADFPAGFAVPVGLASFAPEAIASASIDVRVSVAYTENAAFTDDGVYSAFLAGPQSFPFFN